MSTPNNKPILSVRDLSVTVKTDTGVKPLVSQVTFDLKKGEILGIVGESGSGKSMTCRALIQLLPSSQISISQGAVILKGHTDLIGLKESDMRSVRGRSIGMIFQNPSSHLDPVMTVGRQIMESIRCHHQTSKPEARKKAIDVLRQVGIPDPEQRIDNYPHEFSGGMRQRVMIAIALSCDPEILIADEPTTALDVTVQAQILRLLLELRDKRGLSIILITHDLGVISQVCDSVVVMYGGRICEQASKRDIILNPSHPYTMGLIDCQPSGNASSGPMKTIFGQPPSQNAMPTGCAFHPRCQKSSEICHHQPPPLLAQKSGRMLACYNTNEIQNEGECQ